MHEETTVVGSGGASNLISDEQRFNGFACRGRRREQLLAVIAEFILEMRSFSAKDAGRSVNGAARHFVSIRRDRDESNNGWR